MCLLALAYKAHADCPLVLIGNRDEAYSRPTAALDRWPGEPIYGGRDLQAGGSWLALNRNGRLAALTNVRQLPDPVVAGPSRGQLVADFVRQSQGPEAYFARILAAPYPGFNLLAGTLDALWYGSNRLGQPARAVTPGIHGLSNAFLDSPWPKTTQLTTVLRCWLDRGDLSAWPELMAQLRDDTPAADTALPQTGVPRDVERALSSRFIRTAEYGTRSSIFLRIDRRAEVFWVEWRYDQQGQRCGQSEITFSLNSEALSC